ncbi:MAG: hypothetical protein AAGA18_13780 [Verrucomicrobiota bacterium]
MRISIDETRESRGAKQRRKKLIITAIGLSIILHVIGGAAATIWIIATFHTPPEATFITKKKIVIPPKIMDPRVASAEFEAVARKPVLDQKLSSRRMTQFNLPDVPKMDIKEVVEFDASTIASEAITSMGDGVGMGGGDGGGGTGMEGNLFGMKVKAEKLGVVLDVSFSTHGLLTNVIEQITSQFSGSVIILAPGCGMRDDSDGDVLSGMKFLDLFSKIESGGMSGTNIYNFINRLFNNNSLFKDAYSSLSSSKNLYVLEGLPINGSKRNEILAKGRGGAKHSTHEAFYYLVRKARVDSIYWFADFKDEIEEELKKDVIRHCNSKKIKIYVHDFDGSPNGDHVPLFARETGGEYLCQRIR